MDAEVALDFGVVLYAVLAAVFMVVLAVLFAVRRKDPLMRAHNAPMLILMAIGAAVHIMAEVVANRHTALLGVVETAACPLWGYWAPYVFGAGIFFTGLYMRLFTYTTAVSREFSAQSAASARRWRWPVALLTLFPIACIAALVTVTDGATYADYDRGTCVSKSGYKVAVGAWMSACILALLVSVALFRHGLVSDIVGEVRKQVFVGALGLIVLVAVAFVMLFAEEGLDNVANRFVATFSIATLYLWALGVLGARPLWKTFRHGSGYLQVLDDQLETISQPLTSIVVILKRAEDRSAARLLFADFIAYCSLESTPLMDRGGGKTTPHIAAFYGQMDYWTHRKLMSLGVSDVDMAQWPPLVTTDITRSHDDIIARYFAREGAPTFVDVGLRAKVRDNTTRKNIADNTPVDLFAEAMWWAVETLDEYYGETYLRDGICGRDVFTSAQTPAVRVMIQQMRQSEARIRMLDAKLTVDDESLVAIVPVEMDVVEEE